MANRPATRAEDTRGVGRLPNAKKKKVSVKQFVDVPMRDRGDGRQFVSDETANVPRVWKSSPDHEPAMLAYITPREAQRLRDLDMHDSGIGSTMHYGPNSVPSFQGDGSDNVGGGDPGSTDSYSGGSDYNQGADFSFLDDPSFGAPAPEQAGGPMVLGGGSNWWETGPTHQQVNIDPNNTITGNIDNNWSPGSFDYDPGIFANLGGQQSLLDRLASWVNNPNTGKQLLQNAPIIGPFIKGGDLLSNWARAQGFDVQPSSFAGGSEGVENNSPYQPGGYYGANGQQLAGGGGYSLPGVTPYNPGGFTNAGPYLGQAGYSGYGINY